MISLIFRIFKQMKSDKRSLFMMLLAPLLIMALVHVLLTEPDENLKLLAVNLPEPLLAELESNSQVEVAVEADIDRLESGEIDAILQTTAAGLRVKLYQPDSSKLKSVLHLLQNIFADQINVELEYVRGNPNWGLFDTMIGIFLSIMSFFFVFLIAGISFIRERTSGTLERMLQTPIRRSAVIGGYILGYGFFATVQSQLIVLFVKYGLKTTFVGSYMTVGITMTLIAIIAVSTGALVSIFANTEFQIVQFVPVVIIPQIFLSGLIPIQQLPKPLDKLAYLTPIYHGSVALEKTMLYGETLFQIAPQIMALLVILLVLFILNTVALKSVKNI